MQSTHVMRAGSAQPAALVAVTLAAALLNACAEGSDAQCAFEECSDAVGQSQTASIACKNASSERCPPIAARAQALSAACKTALPATITRLARADIQLGPAEVIGLTETGIRLNYYVQGGTVEGAALSGKWRAAGGDWFTLRPDGVGLLDVRATFEAADGTLADVRYESRVDTGPDGFARFPAVGPVLPLRAMPEFRAPLGSVLEPLNHTRLLNVGQIDLSMATVSYDVYGIGAATDETFCEGSTPFAVEHVFSYRARSSLKASGLTAWSEVATYALRSGSVRGDELNGGVGRVGGIWTYSQGGVTQFELKSSITPDQGSFVNMSLRARATTVENGILSLRGEPSFATDSTELEWLNRDSLVALGQLDLDSRELVLHVYRLPTSTD